ncbi:MAG: hypothetical protein EA425_08755 [Puniceicoccaceae bacterium]|nr:MAG: hypothetical protein EA425_08755 [Puniceicoccaceae bacterium]
MPATIATLALGILLILVLTPLAQFLTVMTVNADIETGTPVGWAVGLIFSLVLVMAALRALARWAPLGPGRLVVLYAMLTLAVPLMNLGLVRPFYNASMAVVETYLHFSVNTYRIAYNSLHPDWFPKIPTLDGLAWHQAERTLELLDDSAAGREREEAGALLARALREAESGLKLLGEAEDAAIVRTLADVRDRYGRAALRGAVGRLGPDQILRIDDLGAGDVLAAWGLAAPLAERRAKVMEASRRAAAELPALLNGISELELSLVPEVRSAIDRSSQDRLEAELRRLAPEEHDALESRVATVVAPRFDALRERVAALGRADHALVRRMLQERARERLAAMERSAYEAELAGFVYRANRNDRLAMARQDGTDGSPNMNTYGFRHTLWQDPAARQARERQSWSENLSDLVAGIPWQLWSGPLLRWGTLFLCIFLFLMCLAEWLRRKWVERENLPFPLVEIADHLLRPDRKLENAEDPREPEPRDRPFSPALLSGLALGFLILSLEAMGHYNLTGGEWTLFFDVSKNLFTTGALAEIDKVFFVISPIVLGIAFLVSLEVSFSIWVSFVIYTAVFWIIGLHPTAIRDSVYTGWADGRFYPFPMEQMMGACLCYTLIVLYKSWSAARAPAPPGPEGVLVASPLMKAGLVGLPLVVAGLLWNLGVQSILLLVLFGLAVLAQTIAVARVRAETGLPTHHISYEFTKFPMVLGLTGMTGSKVYVSFISVVFLPVTLLFRTLPQMLENLELARRTKVAYGTLAVASILAVVTAIGAGLVSFLLYSYYLGESFQGASVHAGQGPAGATQLASYPLWVSHFRGEAGLDQYTSVHWVRIVFAVVGFGVVAALAWLRGRFLRFPIHPVGYMVVLLTIYYGWASPYFKGDAGTGGATWVWGSVLVAWILKKLIIKYGGMNTYKAAKPFFIGLVVGSVLAIFAWNVLDLTATLLAEHWLESPGDFIRAFLDTRPYSPRYY